MLKNDRTLKLTSESLTEEVMEFLNSPNYIPHGHTAVQLEAPQACFWVSVVTHYVFSGNKISCTIQIFSIN